MERWTSSTALIARAELSVLAGVTARATSGAFRALGEMSGRFGRGMFAVASLPANDAERAGLSAREDLRRSRYPSISLSIQKLAPTILIGSGKVPALILR